MKKIIALVVPLVFLVSAHGATTQYFYEGNSFDTFGSDFPQPSVTFLSISLLLANPLPRDFIGSVGADVIEATITDGYTTLLTDSLGWDQNFNFRTNSSGKIIGWNINGHTFGESSPAPDGELERFHSNYMWPDETAIPPFEEGMDYIVSCDDRNNPPITCLGNPALSSSPGIWNMTQIPIPATVWLFASALALIGLIRRRTTSFIGPH